MTRRKVRHSTAAHEDYASILEHVLASSGLDAALAVDGILDRAIRSLALLPDRGRVVPELRERGYAAYREIIAAPYRIVYRASRLEVWILAVVDGRRDADELLFERARRS